MLFFREALEGCICLEKRQLTTRFGVDQNKNRQLWNVLLIERKTEKSVLEMSNGIESDDCGEVVDRSEQSLTEDEESMIALYQNWGLEETLPGIIGYMLDFRRSEYQIPQDLSQGRRTVRRLFVLLVACIDHKRRIGETESRGNDDSFRLNDLDFFCANEAMTT